MTDLTPGPEMDRAVAEVVGFRVQEADRRWSDDTCRVYRVTPFPSVFRPSTDIANAIEALEETGHCWSVRHFLNGCYVVSVGPPEGSYSMAETFGEGFTLPEAACRAILAWAEAKEKNDDV